jgi:hypothetical protein
LDGWPSGDRKFDGRALLIVAGVLMAIPGIAALFVREIRDA